MTSRQRDIGRKYESGAEKERAKRKREAFIETQRGAINKFLRPAHLESKSGSGNVEDTCSSSTGDGERGNHEEPPRPPSSGPTSVAPPMEESPGSREPSPAASAVGPSLEPPIVSEDPGNWPRHIDANTKRILVERGPPKITKPYIFPKSEGRGFSEDFCRYTLVNGEKSERSWLIYSKQKDSAYCFCCRIFSDLSRHDTRTSALSKEEGFRDWKHCSERLRKHQCSPEHFKHFAEWTELEQRLAKKSTVDKVNEGIIDRERKHWQDVLTRILAGVQYLAETNSAFRGSSSTLYERDNGNFLKLMEMLATFDPPMREHLRRVRDKKTHVHYMGPEIQNEMISLIAETTSDPAVRSEALSLVEHSLKSLEFVLGLVLWYDLLQAVNRVSKTLQAVDSTLDTTLQHLQGLKSFIQDYRENGFKKALTTARELVESLGCESEFKVPRIRRPKPQLGQKRTREPNRSEEVSHQELQDEAEEKFRIGYFLPILDVALTSMSSRFEEIEFYASKFGFLFNPSKLSDQEDEKLEEFCKNLAIYLKDGDSEDIDETDFVAEMKSFKYVVPSSVTTALGALRYLGPIRESYPNLTIALRIMLTIPMTVASGERSFSKLKIIKNYLRSTMSQARLNDLAMISIEREVAHSLRMDELISNFAYAKARRAPFL
ncbi:hypothetical protein ACJJTC_002406 [Scirpophaga incertulas]